MLEFKYFALWVPVLMAVGIGAYFSLKTEPAGWAAILTGMAGVMAFLLLRNQGSTCRALSGAILCIVMGFCVAQIRTNLVAAPVIDVQTGVVLVEGKLLELENQSGSTRYLIELDYLQSDSSLEIPNRVRVTWRGEKVDLEPGQSIRMRAVLSPPPEPVMPGGFDFARLLYFQKIGAVGYAVSPPVKLADKLVVNDVRSFIERVRLKISDRIYSALASTDPEVAAVCVALITGKRSGISDDTEQILRDAGLAHLLAISGLHMGLVAGILFFVVRYLLACSERLALHYPIKKWAAVAALSGAFIYLMLSGAGWSSRRAFIMAAVFFIAIILDRRAISLRNVAIAATLILLSTPEALFQAGFQMSFAAVTVLIAAYEWYQKRQGLNGSTDQSTQRFVGQPNVLVKYIGGLSITSLLAGFATSPFAIYHFNRFAVYGLAGNLLAMPIMGFVIMPAAISAFVLMPLGLDWIGWRIMGMSVDAVLNIANMVSLWPGAVSEVAQTSFLSFLLFIVGGLCLCLFQSPLRVVGAGLLICAMVSMSVRQSADIIIDRTGKNMAFRIETEEGALLVPLRQNIERFSLRNWLRADGQSEDLSEVRDIKWLARDSNPDAFCTDDFCEIKLANGPIVAITESIGPLGRLCTSSRVVILQMKSAPQDLRSCAAVLVDQSFLAREGATSITFRRGNINIKTSREMRGQRPWSPG